MSDTPMTLDDEKLRETADVLSRGEQDAKTGHRMIHASWLKIAADGLTELLERRASASSAEGVRVRKLEWQRVTKDTHINAESVAGRYVIVDSQWFCSDGESDPIREARSHEEAKAAAQADYEQRIRSALEPSPSQPTVAVPAGMDELRAEAAFLLDRLDDLQRDWDQEPYREFSGHVVPSMERLRILLSAAPTKEL